MQHRKSIWLATLLTVSLLLSACNIGQEPEPTPDVGAIFTAAAQTVSAEYNQQLTQTALAAPTNTPSPTVTLIPTFSVQGTPGAGLPSPIAVGTQPTSISPLASPTLFAPVAASTPTGPVCNSNVFEGDLTIPDGTIMKPGEKFVKSWQIRNTGTCTWDDGYSLVYLGSVLGGYNLNITQKHDFTAPGEAIVFSLELRAPTTPNTYEECWRMKGDDDFFFGTYMCVKIVVQ